MRTILIIGVIMCAAFSCDRPTHAATDLPRPAIDLSADKTGNPATAVFAGGCFWCTEAVFEQLNGVSDVVSGYAGGKAEDANYEAVGSGQTGHAECIQITYDPTKVTYGQLMRVLFTTINPTTKNGQHPDYGTQYRSAIFVASEDEHKVAEAYIKQLDEAKIWEQPIATTVEPLTKFYPAEGYHQDFASRNPKHAYIRQFSAPKLLKLKEHFKDEVKPATQPSKK